MNLSPEEATTKIFDSLFEWANVDCVKIKGVREVVERATRSEIIKLFQLAQQLELDKYLVEDELAWENDAVVSEMDELGHRFGNIVYGVWVISENDGCTVLESMVNEFTSLAYSIALEDVHVKVKELYTKLIRLGLDLFIGRTRDHVQVTGDVKVWDKLKLTLSSNELELIQFSNVVD